MKKTIGAIFTGIAVLALVACGVGGGDTKGVTVKGTITGLDQSGLVLQLNGANDLAVTSGSTSFVFDGLLAPFAKYAVTIKTQPTPQTCSVSSGSGAAPFSVSEPPISNVVISCGTVNTVPQGLSAAAKNASATLAWSPVAGATQYRLYYAASASLTAANTTEVDAGTATTYTLNGLTNGTTYTVAVSAVFNGVISTRSSTVSVTPTAGRIANTATYKLAKPVSPTTYEKNSNLGASLPSTSAQGTADNEWACTLDSTSGLLWELKTDGASTSRPKTYTYSYASAQTYIADINASKLCGFDDWRLPTRAELQSLVNYGLQGLTGAIDQAMFPNTDGQFFWTATAQAGDNTKAWFVDFGDGKSKSASTADTYRVRLVRAGSSTPPSMVIDTTDPTEIEDVANGIVWQRCAANLSGDGCTGGSGTWDFTFSDAKTYVSAQATATSKAWRLPTVKELASLADLTKVPSGDSNTNPALNLANFPGDYQGKAYWTDNEAAGDNSKAWIVDFYNGVVEQYDRTWNARVRLVRNK